MQKISHFFHILEYFLLVNPESSCERRVCECDRKLASELAGQLAAGFNVRHDFQDDNYEMNDLNEKEENQKISGHGRNETCRKLPKLQTAHYGQIKKEGNNNQDFEHSSGKSKTSTGIVRF